MVPASVLGAVLAILLYAAAIWRGDPTHNRVVERLANLPPTLGHRPFVVPVAATQAARWSALQSWTTDQIARWGLVEGGHDMDRVNADVSVAASSVFLNFLGDAATTAATPGV